jgi:PPP family 3-phenylpropionic acid transporter
MSSHPAATAAPPHYALRMWAFFAGYFVVGGVSLPFFPVWLEARGLSKTEIASCIAIPIFVRVFLTPLAGMFADRAPNRRFAIRLFIVIGAAIFFFAWPARSYWPLLIVTGASTILWSVALPVAEALALTGVRRFGLDYGRMRFGGSVSFISANLGSGVIVGMIATDSIFFLIALALVISAVASFVLPVTPRAVRALDDRERPPTKPAYLVLSQPSFLALVLVGGLIQASHAVLYSFGSIYWRSTGFSGAEIGAFWATGVFCEIAVFMWSGAAIRIFGPYGLLVIGGLAVLVRWVLMSFDLDFFGFAALQCLHGLTFGAVYVGNQHAIARAIPEEFTASAQGVFVMVQGLLLALATMLAGPLYTAYGRDAFLFMTVPAGLALVILLVYRRFERKPAAA